MVVGVVLAMKGVVVVVVEATSEARDEKGRRRWVARLIVDK